MSGLEAVVTGIIADGVGVVAVWAWNELDGGAQRTRLRSIVRNQIDEAVDAAFRADVSRRSKKEVKREIRNVADDDRFLEALMVGSLAGPASELDERWRQEFRAALAGDVRARLHLDALDQVIDVSALLHGLPSRLRSAIHRDATDAGSPLGPWWIDLRLRLIHEQAERSGVDDTAVLRLLTDVHQDVSAVRRILSQQRSTGQSSAPGLRSRTRSDYDIQLQAYGDLHSELVGREQEVERLAGLAYENPYLVIVGEPWSGKTAIMTHLADRLRDEGCSVVQFYVQGGYDDTAVKFFRAVIPQLQLLNNDAIEVAERLDEQIEQFSALWVDVVHTLPRRRRVVLCVDGLDEQDPSSPISHHLPAHRASAATVIVSTRPQPDLADHLPDQHPLKRTSAHQRYVLEPSKHAVANAARARAAVDGYLRDDDTTKRDVVGFLASSPGPLSAAELAELLEGDRFAGEITSLLEPFKRNLLPVIDLDTQERFTFGHIELRRQARQWFAGGGERRYVQRLLDWGDSYASGHATPWPDTTPWYLVRYYDELARHADWSDDHADRLLDLCGDARARLLRQRLPHLQPLLDTLATTISFHRDLGDERPSAVFTIFKLVTCEHEHRTVANNLTSEIPHALAATGQRRLALEIARSMVDDRRRARALSKVASVLDDADVASEALRIARQIPDVRWQLRTLADIVNVLGDAGLVSEVLQRAGAIRDLDLRARTLAVVVGPLASVDPIQVLETVRGMPDVGWRMQALAAVVGPLALVNPTLALQTAQSIAYVAPRARTLAAVVGPLALVNPTLALQTAQSIAYDDRRARALAEVVGPLALVDPTLALQTAQSIAYDDRREWALAEVVGPLALVDPTLALTTARTITDTGWRARALTHIARTLDDPKVASEALDTATSTGDNDARARSLAEVVGPLSAVDPALALDAARSIADTRWRTRALTDIARTLEDAKVASEALDTARSNPDNGPRTHSLADVVGPLAAVDPALALRLARGVTDGAWQARMLARLARALGDVEVADEALEIAQRIPDDGPRARTLAEVAGPLASVDLTCAMTTARTISDEHWREVALVEVVGPFASVDPTSALETARSIPDPGRRARAIAEIARVTGDAARATEAIESAGRVSGVYWRGWALAAVVEPLASVDSSLALKTARNVSDAGWRARAVAGVARVLNDTEVATEALRIARGITAGDRRAWALANVAGPLASVVPAEALKAMHNVPDHYWREWAAAEAGGSLTLVDPTLDLEFTRSIPYHHRRARTFADVVGSMTLIGPARALEATRAIPDDDSRARALVAVAAQLASNDALHSSDPRCLQWLADRWASP